MDEVQTLESLLDELAAAKIEAEQKIAEIKSRIRKHLITQK